MASHEQYKFAFPEEPKKESSPVTPEPSGTQEKREYYGPAHIEANDECNYCGFLYESESSCQYCANNPTKRAYLEKLKK